MRWLVGYDVEGVHRYVFEPIRPMDIAGGSRLLEDFATQAAQLAREMGAEPIYSAGGTGLFRAPDQGLAQDLATRLPALLARATADGARCTAAVVPEGDDIGRTRSMLWAELRRARLSNRLREPPRVLVPGGTWPPQVCEGCGREPASASRQVGGRLERIGARCEVRYRAGRGKSPEIPALFGAEGEDVPPGAVLAGLYVDGDGLGERLGRIEDLHELGRIAVTLVQGTRRAAGAAARAAARPVLPVVVGGDDVLLFCDAACLFDVAEALWGKLDALGDEVQVRFSTGIAVGDPYLPLRLFFQTAELALRAAKRRSYVTNAPHVGLRSLMIGTRYRGDGDLFGGPLRTDVFRRSAQPSVPMLIEALQQVSGAQRAGIEDDLTASSREEVDLALDHRTTVDRDGGMVGQAVRMARQLAGVSGADVHALLSGALAWSRFGG